MVCREIAEVGYWNEGKQVGGSASINGGLKEEFEDVRLKGCVSSAFEEPSTECGAGRRNLVARWFVQVFPKRFARCRRLAVAGDVVEGPGVGLSLDDPVVGSFGRGGEVWSHNERLSA